jgi:release factor glutamine methyltransferase
MSSFLPAHSTSSAPAAAPAALVDDPVAQIVSTLRAAGCVFAEEEAQLLVDAATSPADLAGKVEQRVSGLPLEHLLGWARFCGLRIAVDPGVFVPRQRTEFLARQAMALAIRTGGTPTVLDLCCGSGAVGAALAAALDRIELHAADIEPAAVRCARRNLTKGQVYEGDLYRPLPRELRGRIDVLVANAPYVPTGAIGLMPPEARLHEPRVALDGGDDGLDVLRRVIGEAPRWLAPGGSLLVEASAQQAPLAVETIIGSGFSAQIVTSEELDATVVIGTSRGRELPG